VRLAALVAIAAATAVTFQVPAPVLSPRDELKTITLPAGYRLELVASEPLVHDPVVIDWDADGRLWVVEMTGYMNDIQAGREHDPAGRIVVLQDTNRDGRMDKRTVFADGLILPRALKVLDRGVLVGEPPNLWFMKDANRDLKADGKELVTSSYGRLDANVEHNANSLLWTLDNWIQTSEVDVFLRYKRGAFEVRRTMARGQWGATQDDAGRVFRNSNESALRADLVPSYYYRRNPALVRTRGSDEFLGRPPDDLNAVWPAHPTRGVNRGYQAGILRDDGRLAHFTSASAPTVFRGDRLPAELYGSVFVAEPAANLVSRIVVTDDGTTLRAKKAYETSEFIASTDERFRPVYLSSAPDGTLYVVDMYRGIIQHRGYITEYLRDQILSRSLEQPIGLGRIWRVVHDTTKRGPDPSLSRASTAELVRTLSHPNGWWRDTAQQLLVQRGDASAVPALSALAAAPPVRTRLQALWTLDALDALDPAAVLLALRDPSRDVRIAGVRLAERWLRDADRRDPAGGGVALEKERADLPSAVMALGADPDWAVRAQVGASLGELATSAKAAAIAAFLARNANDPVAADAALSGVAGSETAVMDALTEGTSETPERAAAVTMLTATIVSGAQDASVQRLFDFAADASRPTWQRAAVLRGASVTLLGSDAPGSPARGRGRGASPDAPCPTCPGGRAGPGGAAAFPTTRGAAPEGETPAPARGRGAQRPPLKLTREPALVALAAANAGDLSVRAGELLPRLEWPGKPGMAAVTPLTPAEQARFDAGRIVYQNLCQACHQPDGRGREQLAPPLVGSAFALTPDVSIPIRIVLNGKEGPVGLMPPLGGALSDDQIAGALTYIRREWGHTASAVEPSAVPPVRRDTAGRTRPWTNDELTRRLGGG